MAQLKVLVQTCDQGGQLDEDLLRVIAQLRQKQGIIGQGECSSSIHILSPIKPRLMRERSRVLNYIEYDTLRRGSFSALIHTR